MAGKGNYVELTTARLDDGEFLERFDRELRTLMQRLHQYELESGNSEGKAELVIKVKVQRETEQYFGVNYDFSQKLPKLEHGTMVRGAKGKLLVDPEGDDLNDKNQMVMTFDGRGNPKGQVDAETGEVVESDEDEPAGKIGGATA